MFYIAKDNSVFRFTTSSSSINTVRISSTRPDDRYRTNGNSDHNKDTDVILNQGYYWLRVNQNRDSVSTFTSDPYPCPPYSGDFSDYQNVFIACTPKPIPLANAHQENAIKAHLCGKNQFYANSMCQDVDPAKNCNTFNPLGGECQTCFNSRWTLTNGVCIPPGQSVAAAVALPQNCASVDSTGACTSCISLLYRVDVASGSCILKTCPSGEVLDINSGNCVASCASTQQAINNICYNKPANCLRINHRFIIC